MTHAGAQGPAVPVTTRPLAPLLFHPEPSAPAEVVPRNAARVSAEITARVLTLPVRVGDRVAREALVATLDCREYRARLAGRRATARGTEARLDLARAQLQRARELRDARNVSAEEVDRRQAEVRALEADLAAQEAAREEAALEVERCTVVAPYGAVVSERLASVGDRVAPGTPLVRLIELDGAEVSARLRPAEALEAAGAEGLAFHWLDRRHPVTRLATAPVIDPATRTVVLRFAFTGEAAPPGASGRLSWRARQPHLPAELLVRRDGLLGVFLAVDGRARFEPLPGALEGRPAPADLAPGARVILEGRHGLNDGDPVREVSGEPVGPTPQAGPDAP